MPDEPDKPGGEAEAKPDAVKGSAEDAENERPTVSPPFDPIAFAKEILSTPSSTAIPAILAMGTTGLAPPPTPSKDDEGPPASAREDLHTHATPPQGTEQQIAALEASRRLGGAQAEVRRKTPTSTISLANARIPSNLPPRLDSPSTPISSPRFGETSSKPNDGPQKTESLSSMNAVDREWADLEIATRPPPADSPHEDPVLEIERAPKLDLDDIDLDEHSADTVRRPIPPEILGVPGAHPKEPSAPSAGSGKISEREMNDRVSLGDYSGALEIAEKLLNDNPDDAAAKACAENCRTVLRQMYATRIGPLDRVPIVMIPRDQLRWLSIDHKAGFVLSLVDGVSSLEMIIDVSGMPELDTLRILSELAQQRIISLR